MTEDFKELFIAHCQKLENNTKRVEFTDKLIKFYAEYIGIISEEFDKMEQSLSDEYEDKKDALPIEVCIRFDEKLAGEIKSSKKEEEKKTRDLIDWLLEQRTEFTKNDV
jgi:hypothetical protein